MDPRAEASIAIKNELLCQFLEFELQCEQMRAWRIHGKVGLDGFSTSDRYRNTLALIEAINPNMDSANISPTLIDTTPPCNQVRVS